MSKLQQQGFQVLHKSYNNFFVFPLAAGLILLRRGRAEPKLASPHFDDEAYQVEMEAASPLINTCLLYTSDAADERSSVDLGGRRIIKKTNTTKKNKKNTHNTYIIQGS